MNTIQKYEVGDIVVDETGNKYEIISYGYHDDFFEYHYEYLSLDRPMGIMMNTNHHVHRWFRKYEPTALEALFYG